MAKITKQHVEFHNGIHELQLSIREDADSMLNAINIDKLLDSPTEYLELLGTAFIERHQVKIQKGFSMGRKHGEYLTRDLNED